MEAYPWYSVDSSSWVQTAAFGAIFTPQWGTINVSEKSPQRHDAGQHLSTPEQSDRISYLNTSETVSLSNDWHLFMKVVRHTICGHMVL